jgi:hypothetical protein
MFKWLLALFAALFSANTVSDTDYVGRIAAEAAYSSLMTSVPTVKPLVPTKDCTTCNGTGRIRTGDSNHPWTKCPDCEGVPTGDVKTPKSDPDRYQPHVSGTVIR